MWVLAGDDVLHDRLDVLPGVGFMIRSDALRLAPPHPTDNTGVSEARAANHARQEQLKATLADTGGVAVEAFGKRRQLDPDAALILAHDYQHAGRLVVVEHNGNHLIPGCLLDEDLVPIPIWRSTLQMLLEAGYSPWGVWVWIATPTTWLDNKSPAELIRTDPDRVFRAVEDKIQAMNL